MINGDEFATVIPVKFANQIIFDAKWLSTFIVLFEHAAKHTLLVDSSMRKRDKNQILRDDRKDCWVLQFRL